VAGVAIRAEGVGKRYELGERESYGTLRDTLARAVRTPMRKRGGSPAREFWALHDVSFEVPKGEVLAVIGRNGAGKSTLLKILTRITYPTEGRIEIRGRVGSLLEVGTGFHPELTGRENVFLNGAVLGMRRAEIAEKFAEIVAFAEIDRFLDTPVKRYSSGMYVRLAFAVAAHLEPEVLLVDEVLAVGDAAFQRKCLGKLEEVTSGGRTVLFVSHNMAAVQELCQRALLVDGGRVRSYGPTDEVVADYLEHAADPGDAVFDLSEHLARAPQYEPAITRLAFTSDAGAPATSFAPDDALVAELTIAPSKPLREPLVALSIADSFGRRITTVASYFQPGTLDTIEGVTRVRCRIPELRLGTGRYLVSVSVGDKYQGLLDSLEDVGAFDVTWSNYWGNGESFHPHYGPVLTSSDWELQS
jgi:lipopolysaccharide transport system ATP-binding protein